MEATRIAVYGLSISAPPLQTLLSSRQSDQKQLVSIAVRLQVSFSFSLLTPPLKEHRAHDQMLNLNAGLACEHFECILWACLNA